MNADDMASAILAEYKKVTDAVDWENGERPSRLAYVQAFDKGLTEYVEENMEITYSWSATLPPPASSPDPVTSFISELAIDNKDIGQPVTVAAWGPLIMLCFEKTETKHPAAFSVDAGKLLIKPLIIAPPPAPFPGPIKAICTQIYTWLLTCNNTAALSGTHRPYSGATTGMVIA